MNSNSTLEIRNVTKAYVGRDGSTTIALKNLNLQIEASEFVVLLGPSGCGKSTLLNLIAGFEKPTSGEILMAGNPVNKPDASRAVVFQDSQGSLLPWLTASENVEFGLKLAGVPRGQRRDTAQKFLALVNLGNFATKLPFELSGGMKQRVQIARALATNPEVLLMDEPFGALDALTRESLQDELEKTWQETRKTIVFITHDILEAVRLADRLVVMAAGAHTNVARTLYIDLPRPRDVLSGAAATLAKEVQELMHLSHGKQHQTATGVTNHA
ncbi:ABC transporter ATP-binding protein [Enterobacter ludwigii]|uniref:ABC transporter ATP-binding protein n=1 Tax=Enterobacter ludwigii TaxID=299767 RepID=UPI001C8B6BDA|nr:ABC transporter ATP-binding protein [Enterobacter ludwigii]EES0032875.1 ABC transporter ATP-binding protein [Escherichia coli]EKS6730690.1 ABC transporter ATP-binding protein [Enterobacter mori]MBX8911074.1 ABC transporter ATP-binding protein [Enterobacter ludwigii]MCM7781930.1 ABC transporter ATP-binding protein [Enterobacter ludwigii]